MHQQPLAGQAGPGRQAENTAWSIILLLAGPDWQFQEEGRPNSKPCNILVQVRDDIFEDFMVFLWKFLEYLLKGM